MTRAFLTAAACGRGAVPQVPQWNVGGDQLRPHSTTRCLLQSVHAAYIRIALIVSRSHSKLGNRSRTAANLIGDRVVVLHHFCSISAILDRNP